jgi:hypothetical protein
MKGWSQQTTILLPFFSISNQQTVTKPREKESVSSMRLWLFQHFSDQPRVAYGDRRKKHRIPQNENIKFALNNVHLEPG